MAEILNNSWVIQIIGGAIGGIIAGIIIERIFRSDKLALGGLVVFVPMITVAIPGPIDDAVVLVGYGVLAVAGLAIGALKGK